MNPEVFGTISDWIMIGVTAITAYYLYHTLKSQREVQRAQQKLLKYESYRFREEIRPQFTLSLLNQVEDINGSDIALLNCIFLFKLNNNAATNITIYTRGNWNNNWKLDSKYDFGSLGKNDVIPILTEYNGKLLKTADGKLMASLQLEFNVFYKDIDGNSYKQKCDFSRLVDSESCSSSEPVLLSQYT